jgi:hypothetical protein
MLRDVVKKSIAARADKRRLVWLNEAIGISDAV